MKLVPEVAALLPEIKAWRHHIHAHPETAFEETATSAFVADKLRSFGLDVHTGLAKTGVVGVLRGRSGSDAIGLRADLDALHIHEKTGVAHASQVDGKMHACGHDGHTAMLLGAASALARKQRLRRHRLFHLPARRGKRRRRPRDGRGGTLRAVSDARRLRHAQLAAECRSARSPRASGR